MSSPVAHWPARSRSTALAVNHFSPRRSLQHRLRVGEQRARGFADLVVVENGGIAPASSQVWKNGVQSM
jgi:hypothetical protein